MNDDHQFDQEYVDGQDSGSMTPADQDDWNQIQRYRPRARPTRTSTVGNLILTWAAQLKWTQARLADELSMDASQLAKIINGRQKKPHVTTLARIVEKFQENGLSDITLDMLIEARDDQVAAATGKRNPLEIPDHWRRLIQNIRLRGAAHDDTMFRLFSSIHRETVQLIDHRPEELQSPDDDT